jgi:hypothetical protein
LDPNDPTIPPDMHDLARIYALEHMVSTLYLLLSIQIAETKGMGFAQVATELRENVKGSMTEGDLPPAFLALMRHHAGKVLDHAVDSARTADELSGAGNIAG